MSSVGLGKRKCLLYLMRSFHGKIRAQVGTYRMYCATITFIQADMKVVRVYFLIVMHELMLIINDGD